MIEKRLFHLPPDKKKPLHDGLVGKLKRISS